ncbi:MAG: response regulator [Chloroflexi bacterium]|nr:response regulator [Chloroflexota bacterium]
MNQTILCLETQPNMARLTSWVMEPQGYDVLWAASEDEGLLMADVFTPAVILMDISNFPHIDVAEVARKLRSHKKEQIAQAPIVGVVDMELQDLFATATDGFFDRVLSKPVTQTQLRQHVVTLLSKRS